MHVTLAQYSTHVYYVYGKVNKYDTIHYQPTNLSEHTSFCIGEIIRHCIDLTKSDFRAISIYHLINSFCTTNMIERVNPLQIIVHACGEHVHGPYHNP